MINIIGRVAGTGIEAVGTGLRFGAKAIAGITRGAFFVFGKNVDMIETLKDMRNAREISGNIRPLEVQSTVTMPLGREAVPTAEGDTIERVLSLIRLALEYSTRAYNEKMLPIEQIVLVDRQAQIMSNAIEQYLRKQGDFEVKKIYGGKVESLVLASSLFMKYHRSGNEQLCRDAERMLKEVM